MIKYDVWKLKNALIMRLRVYSRAGSATVTERAASLSDFPSNQQRFSSLIDWSRREVESRVAYVTRLTCAGPAALTTRRVRPRSWQVPTTGSSNRARGGNWMSHVWMPWMRHKSAAGAPRMPPSKARAAPLARIGSRPKIARNLSTHRKGTEADGATPPATPRRERNPAPPTQLARTAPCRRSCCGRRPCAGASAGRVPRRERRRRPDRAGSRGPLSPANLG